MRAFALIIAFFVGAVTSANVVSNVINKAADDAQRRHTLAFFGSSTPAKKPDAAGPVEVYEPPKDGQVKANMEADKKTEAGATKSTTTTPSSTTTKMTNDGEVRNILLWDYISIKSN